MLSPLDTVRDGGAELCKMTSFGPASGVERSIGVLGY